MRSARQFKVSSSRFKVIRNLRNEPNLGGSQIGDPRFERELRSAVIDRRYSNAKLRNEPIENHKDTKDTKGGRAERCAFLPNEANLDLCALCVFVVPPENYQTNPFRPMKPP